DVDRGHKTICGSLVSAAILLGETPLAYAMARYSGDGIRHWREEPLHGGNSCYACPCNSSWSHKISSYRRTTTHNHDPDNFACSEGQRTPVPRKPSREGPRPLPY